MKKTIIVILFCVISAFKVGAQRIDSTFTTNGYLPYSGALSNSSHNAYGGNNMVRQPDGKLVVAEDYTGDPVSDNYYYTYRYDTNGMPDSTFGTFGVSAIFCGNQSNNRDLQLQADGKIVVTGATEYCTLGVCGALQFIMMRLKADGSLDSTFGNNGKLVTIDIFGTSGLFALPQKLKILPDGKFIVGGKGPGGAPFVARLKSNGFPDSTFATNGVYTDTAIRTTFKDLAINGDGDILMLLDKYNYAVATGADTANLLDNYVIKVKASGARDITFGAAGSLVFSGSNAEHPTSIAVRGNGSIVVVGDEQYNNTEDNNWNGTGTNGYGMTNKGYVAFITASGTLTSYRSIHIPTDSSTFFHKVIVLNDNRLFIGGRSVRQAGSQYQEQALLTQIDSNGNYIPDFNTTGYWLFDYGVVGTGWQGKLCAINDIDVQGSDVYATGYRNPTAGSSALSLFLLKLKDVITGVAPSGIVAYNNRPVLSLYPNPVEHNSFTVESADDTRYTIYDICGRVVCMGTLVEGKNNLQLPAYAACGTYFLTDNTTKQVVKFIKF